MFECISKLQTLVLKLQSEEAIVIIFFEITTEKRFDFQNTIYLNAMIKENTYFS